MVGQDFSNLTGKILIATPYTMENNIFHQSLVYIVHHGIEGSIGFIINRPITNEISLKNLLKKTDSNIDISSLNLEILIGGPIKLERGFFLHSAEYDKNLLFKPENSDLAVSSNVEILQDITAGIGPKLNMFTIGYTAWNAGQIEFEIQNNLWLITKANKELIFGAEPSSKWLSAITNLGIDSSDFVPHLANC
ncbi:MAG: YqgE/AlgH family protein [Rickettsiaceae bacterium]